MGLEQILSNLSGGAVLVVALVLIARVLWTDRRAERRLDRYTSQLEQRVNALDSLLTWERLRRAQLELVLVRAGLELPDPPQSPDLSPYQTEGVPA